MVESQQLRASWHSDLNGPSHHHDWNGKRSTEQKNSAAVVTTHRLRACSRPSEFRSPVRGVILAISTVAASLLIGTVAGCGTFGHSQSWKNGYNEASKASHMTDFGTSAKWACDSIANTQAAFGPKQDWDDFKAGCRAWFKEHGEN